MSPPINLDGDTVDAITMDGTDVSEVTVDGSTVFGPIPDSAVSRWTFNISDTDSGTAVDRWGSHDGSINGATMGVSGANQTYDTKEAYNFDGSDDTVRAENVGTELSTGGSVALWVLMDSSVPTDNPNEAVYDFEQSGTRRGFSIHFGNQKNNGGYEFITADSNDTFETLPSNVTTVGSWVHLVAAADDNEKVIYADGIQENSTTGQATPPYSDLGDIVFGAAPFDSIWSPVTIDDPRVYDKKLTPTEVSNLYNTGSING